MGNSCGTSLRMFLRLSIILTLAIYSTLVNCCDTSLPEVDLSSPDAGIELVDAFQTWGFSYVSGHNVDQELIEKSEKHTKRFFNLPSRVKTQIQADPMPFVQKTVRGYQQIRNEQLDLSPNGRPDLKEILDFGRVNRSSTKGGRFKRHYLGENKWPEGEKDLENVMDEYAENSAIVAKKVLQLLAEGLGAEGAFDEVFDEDALQVQRLTRYPASNSIEDRKEGEIGSGTHSDYGGVTVLYADGPGLQVLKPDKDSKLIDVGTFSEEISVPHSGEWIDVESRPGKFIVMGGEALQRLSNGLIFAAKHRVGLTGRHINKVMNKYLPVNFIFKEIRTGTVWPFST